MRNTDDRNEADWRAYEQSAQSEYEHEKKEMTVNRPQWSRRSAVQAVVKNEQPANELGGVERALIQGDLSKLNEVDRLKLYNKTCESLGLNPLTKPFEYVELDKKLTLYARKDCTDQLRTIKGISINKLEARFEHNLYIVTAYATDRDGRTDVATAAVSLTKEDGTWEYNNQTNKKFFKKNGKILQLEGDALANAIMKCETKAKRRVTLSLAGLGFIDESEIETIPDAKVISSHQLTEVVHHQQPAIQQNSSTITEEVSNMRAADCLELLMDVYKHAYIAHKGDKKAQLELEVEYRKLKANFEKEAQKEANNEHL
jgi:hypothetical protein